MAESKDPLFQKWLGNLYNVATYKDDEISKWYSEYSYQGFSRHEVLMKLFKLSQDPKLIAQIILACSLRGPKAASKTRLLNGMTLEQMGLMSSNGKGTTNITCARVSSATADLAAYFMKKLNVPARLSHNCPSWLQFPAAGSIKMPPKYRDAHKSFSQEFSRLIGGIFNENIYNQMVLNSYLNVDLKLFEDV